MSPHTPLPLATYSATFRGGQRGKLNLRCPIATLRGPGWRSARGFSQTRSSQGKTRRDQGLVSRSIPGFENLAAKKSERKDFIGSRPETQSLERYRKPMEA